MHEVREFGSWEEFVSRADENEIPNAYSHSEGRYESDWMASKSWEECLTLARDGWKELRPEVKKLSETIQEDLRETLIDVSEEVWEVTGDCVDIGAYMSGVPECMVTQTPIKVSREGKVISFLVCASASSGIDPSAIIKRGSAICSLIECLEVCKHSTEIFIEQTVEGMGRGETYLYTILIKVKSANEPLNIDKVMFCISHPSVLRRLMFSVEEQESPSIVRAFSFGPTSGGYGKPTHLRMKEKVGSVVNLDLMRYDHSNIGADPEGWVRRNLTDLGLIEGVNA